MGNTKLVIFTGIMIICIFHCTTSTGALLCNGVCASDDGCPYGTVCKIGLEDTLGKCCSNQKKMTTTKRSWFWGRRRG